ncbi:MAG: hypothetical protein IPI60_20390 [Saprospiraceae bacterium]|nr:hypothetical protein [Saprospiraceae bacterium]
MKFLWILSILIFCNCSLNAQPDLPFMMPYIRHFTPEIYNAQNQNWGIAQSKTGEMYFANNAGLLEFDGSSWRLMPLLDRQTLRSIAIGADGRVYGGGFETFGYWDPVQYQSNYFRALSAELKISLGKEEIWNILSRDSGLYFQSFSTIYKFDAENINTILPPDNIMFLQSVDNRVYFQVIDGGMYELKKDNSLELLPGSNALEKTKVSFILPGFKSGELLIGTQDDGVYLYSENEIVAWKHPWNNVLKSQQLNKGIKLQNGSYVFGTILEGVYIFNSSGKFLHHINKETGLQNNTVLSLFEDKDGNVWVGMDKGIDLIELNNPLRYFNDYSGALGTVYTAILNDGYLYLGTNQGVYFKNISEPGRKFQLLLGTQGQVWAFYSDGTLLCGHNNGTYEIRKETAKLVSDITGGWSFAKVPGHDNKLLVGVYSGLILLKKDNSGSWVFDRRITGFNEPVKRLLFDENHFLWVVHPQKGVHRLLLDTSLDHIKEIKSYGESDGVKDLYKLHLFHWENQIALKSNCLYIRDPKLDKFECINTGRYGWNVKGSRIFGADSLWFMSKNSQLWAGRKDTILQKLNVRLVPDYEQIFEFKSANAPPFYLFCQENGFAIIDKQSFNNHKSIDQRLRLKYAELVKDGKSVEGILADKVRLHSSQNSIRIYYSEVRFDQEPMYRYRLTGIGKEWSEPTTQSSVYFQNLPPGDYNFEVKPEPGTEIVLFSFTILVPWYQSWWAYLLYFLIFAFIIFLVRQYLRSRLLAERFVFEQKMKEQELFREAIASKEKLEQEVHLKSRELAHSAMSLVRKNEVLTDLKSKLHEMFKGDARAKDIFTRINEHIESDQDWDSFVEVFNHVHDDFFKKIQLKYPDLTPGDLKLAAYLRLNLSTKDIAPLLNISVRGLENKRYRLRKKMGLPEDTNLTEYMMSL